MARDVFLATLDGDAAILPRIVAIGVLFFFQAEDGIRARNVTGVQTCALPILDWPLNSDGVVTPLDQLFSSSTIGWACPCASAPWVRSANAHNAMARVMPKNRPVLRGRLFMPFKTITSAFRDRLCLIVSLLFANTIKTSFSAVPDPLSVNLQSVMMPVYRARVEDGSAVEERPCASSS